MLDPGRDGSVFGVRPIPGLLINFVAGPEVLFDIDLVSWSANGR
jgi:hypothetical protein